jgi:hypothetical protein
LMMLQSRWKELLALNDRFVWDHDGSNTIALVRAYQTLPAETLTFPERPLEIPAKFGLAGAPEIEVKVNGIKKRFLIDTGASSMVLASDFAEACGVKPLGRDTVKAATSTEAKVLIQPAVVREFEIGGLVVRNHPSIIIDKKDLEFKLFGLIRILKIDGIVGWNAIQNMDMTVDFKNRKVRIQKPVKAASPERNFFWLGYPFIKATTSSGLPLYFGLDTGANQSHVSDPILSKIDTVGTKIQKVRVGGAGGKLETIQTLKVPTVPLVIGSNLLTFEGLRCGKSGDGLFFNFDGILGNDAAKDGIMRLDFTNGRFEITFPNRKGR